MIKPFCKKTARIKRHKRLRHRVSGDAARPRLAVFKSSKHIYAQLIDDEKAVTIAASSTMEKAVTDGLSNTGNVEAAIAVGKAIAQKARDKGIEQVVFDRGGFLYHGKIKALADAAREVGLQF